MSGLDRVRSWVEAGKQIGPVIRYERGGRPCWLSVGIQRWEGIYKRYVSEIREVDMSREAFIRDEIIPYASFEELLAAYPQQTDIPIEDLAPLKGQRLFNPRFG
ncbi:hypothetical protein F0P96_13735 [Hymenobacter busanensis]|uniref:Uncharacterized protein n=1 Tax=Hymenobacter busanensis TaxID=2607656 RepID=A0A7L4ZY79_9BACT|nr:hypothetical protein [Hymenobacter busanensis]KAA9331308.1 hypothetical protein F0P96_13735 [Hymenobacter busanensis]QHJ08459.1 hypothetical protein GUY19_14660 [Hymenobacter busanensis]